MTARTETSFRLGRPLAALALAFLAALPAMAEAPAPETRAPVRAEKQMVAAADPRAVEAGLAVLRNGGNAIDAAVAVQAMLTLVEPQSSGLGGGAFLLYWDAKTQTLHAFDGRETAPAAIDPRVFLNADGTPKTLRETIVGGQSVGVPGVLAMLAEAQAKFGKAAWATLFEGSITAAEQGFAVSPRLSMLLKTFAVMKDMPGAGAYFFHHDGTPYAAGETLANPDYAQTLRLVAEEGANAFYRGIIAEKIVAAVTHAPRYAAAMTLDDIAGYEAKERDPVCAPYRAYRVCSMPPPTSGGVTLLQILSALERFESQELQPQSASQIHRVAEAERLAYADRALYLADPDFVDVPVAGLLDRDYLLMRRTLIDPARAMPSVEAGRPKGALDFAPHVSPEFQGTTHFSIVDAEGNAVSMTASIEFAFGSQLMAGGFLLNNELTDFSFEPARDGKPIANAVAPGKRPRSSMTPVIIFDADGKPWATLGSPGGESIIGYVAQSVVDLIDGQVDIQSAFDAPRFMRRLGPLEFEEGTPLAGRAAEFEAMGHAVTAARFNSGLHGIRIFADHLEGGADPRREGIAAGD